MSAVLRDAVGELSPLESEMTESLTELERDRLHVLETRLADSDQALTACERDVRRFVKPEDWPYVQMYAEAFNDVMSIRKSINNIIARVKP